VVRTQNDVLDKLAAIPGTQSAAFASAVPMDGVDPNWDDIMVEGQNYSPNEIPPLRMYQYPSPGFLRTIGTRLAAGRELSWADVYGQRPVVLVSENLAREYWGSAQAALGKRVREFPAMPWREVIGVVEDVNERGVQQAAPPIVYWPSFMPFLYGSSASAAVRAVTFVVRSNRAGTESFANQVRQAVWSVNPSLPVASLETMQNVYDRSMARTSFTLVMLAIAGAMALVLGIIGLYGVIAYAVSQRRREIGIRLALGAEPAELKTMFVRHGLRLAAIGTALGLVAAAALMGLMKSLLFGISPLDPVTYAAVPVVLIAAAVLASYMPARRAAAVDPVEALRAE